MSHVRNTAAMQLAHVRIHATNCLHIQREEAIMGAKPDKIWSSLFHLILLDENATAQSLKYFQLDVLELVRPEKYSGNPKHWGEWCIII